jgi:pimeloyl-ACP methyl ester carboxylesterase
MNAIETTNTINSQLRPKHGSKRWLVWSKRIWLGLRVTGIVLVVLGIVGAGYQAIATARDARAFPPPGQLVDVGGYKLHIHCLGSGSPTVVTESGLGGSSPDWSLVQPDVSQSTRICSYDRAGYGWSEAGPSPRTSQQIAKELHTLLEKADLPSPYVLVGHSSGGLHVQVYASQYPEDVLGLVLVDPTPAQMMMRLSPEERQAGMTGVGQARVFSMMQFLGLLRLMPLLGAEALVQLPAAMQAQIRAHRLQNGAIATWGEEIGSFQASIMHTAATPIQPDLPLIVLWHGIATGPVAQEAAAWASMQELVQNATNGKLIVAEKSGHYIPFDRPDVVIDAIHQVVESVRIQQP